jgi:hypothetical protein
MLARPAFGKYKEQLGSYLGEKVNHRERSQHRDILTLLEQEYDEIMAKNKKN